MNDAISGVAGQFLQQLLENQSAKQPTQVSGKRSFESYLQQDQNLQIDETKLNANAPQKEQPQQTSGVEMQKKLDQMQVELTNKINQNKQQSNQLSQMMPELLNSKTRLGLIKEAASKMGNTSKVTNDLSGRFIQIENEYKGVEAIMHSDKNLSTGELLALQARLYQVSQHIEVMSKVVDQMAGGIKTVLNTNV